MMPGPRPGSASGVDFVAKARAAWGEPLPDWILVLAEEANRGTAAAAAARIGYSPGVVSQVLSRTYHKGDLGRVEESVRGALMGTTVDCPVLGEIGRDRCLQEQAEPFRATSAMRAQLYHACRSGCPNARERSS